MAEALGRAETARELRQIEKFAETADNLVGRLRELNNNLQSINNRLFQHPVDSVEKATVDTPEPVRSELEQLEHLLIKIGMELDRSFALAGELDRI